MAQSLGRFGDRRLEKGGRFCWNACWRLVSPAFGSAHSAAIGPARFDLDGFCAIRE